MLLVVIVVMSIKKMRNSGDTQEEKPASNMLWMIATWMTIFVIMEVRVPPPAYNLADNRSNHEELDAFEDGTSEVMVFQLLTYRFFDSIRGIFVQNVRDDTRSQRALQEAIKEMPSRIRWQDSHLTARKILYDYRPKAHNELETQVSVGTSHYEYPVETSRGKVNMKLAKEQAFDRYFGKIYCYNGEIVPDLALNLIANFKMPRPTPFTYESEPHDEASTTIYRYCMSILKMDVRDDTMRILVEKAPSERVVWDQWWSPYSQIVYRIYDRMAEERFEQEKVTALVPYLNLPKDGKPHSTYTGAYGAYLNLMQRVGWMAALYFTDRTEIKEDMYMLAQGGLLKALEGGDSKMKVEDSLAGGLESLNQFHNIGRVEDSVAWDHSDALKSVIRKKVLSNLYMSAKRNRKSFREFCITVMDSADAQVVFGQMFITVVNNNLQAYYFQTRNDKVVLGSLTKEEEWLKDGWFGRAARWTESFGSFIDNIGFFAGVAQWGPVLQVVFIAIIMGMMPLSVVLWLIPGNFTKGIMSWLGILVMALFAYVPADIVFGMSSSFDKILHLDTKDILTLAGTIMAFSDTAIMVLLIYMFGIRPRMSAAAGVQKAGDAGKSGAKKLQSVAKQAVGAAVSGGTSLAAAAAAEQRNSPTAMAAKQMAQRKEVERMSGGKEAMTQQKAIDNMAVKEEMANLQGMQQMTAAQQGISSMKRGDVTDLAGKPLKTGKNRSESNKNNFDANRGSSFI